MKDVFRRLGSDFLSTIVFLVIYLTTDNVILATAVAILGAIGQVIWSRIKGQTLGYMTWASLGLVIVLGGMTLLTHDPRFVLAAGTIAVASTGDMKLWTFYVTVVLIGAKLAAFAIQYVAFRLLVGSRIRAAARA